MGPNFAVEEALTLSASIQDLLRRYDVKPGISKFGLHKDSNTFCSEVAEAWEAW